MEPEKKIENKIVQTYAEDMANVIGSDTEGLVKKIIHGEEENEEEKKNLSPESKKNKLYMIIGLVLIVLAVATFLVLFFRNTVETVPVAEQFAPLIFNDQSTYVEVAGLKKEEIAQTVSNEVRNTKVKNGGVEGIYLTENKQIIGLRRFITLIKGTFVPGDSTLLVNDTYMLGTVHNESSPTGVADGSGFFILLKARSAADIFGPIRAWEGKMFSDLSGFLGISINADTNYLLTKNFADGIIENKNARILYDKNGAIILMYIFADDTSVVITDSKASAHEVILRLASSQKEQ